MAQMEAEIQKGLCCLSPRIKTLNCKSTSWNNCDKHILYSQATKIP